MEQAVNVLRAGGMVNIAPEGTFNRGRLVKGQVGIAYMATQASAPILPIVSYGQDSVISCLNRLCRVPLHVKIGEPMELPQGEVSLKELETYTEQVMNAIARLLPAECRGVYSDSA